MVTIKENSPSNMPLANLTVEDQDFAQQHSWTLLSGSEFFDILTVNSSSSVLRVKQGAILDYEKHREQPISGKKIKQWLVYINGLRADI